MVLDIGIFLLLLLALFVFARNFLPDFTDGRLLALRLVDLLVASRRTLRLCLQLPLTRLQRPFLSLQRLALIANRRLLLSQALLLPRENQFLLDAVVLRLLRLVVQITRTEETAAQRDEKHQRQERPTPPASAKGRILVGFLLLFRRG